KIFDKRVGIAGLEFKKGLDSSFHVYLTARGRGKTDTKAWSFLEEIIKDKDIYLTYKFCEKTGIKYSSFEFHEKGVYYHGKRRIYFCDLFSFDAFYKNLFDLKKLAQEKEKKGDNSGVLEQVKDEEGTGWLLYINLIEGEEDSHSRSLREKVNPFSVN
ncbi:2134_t:CDS:2, partial [Funneliformis geosporum]